MIDPRTLFGKRWSTNEWRELRIGPGLFFGFTELPGSTKCGSDRSKNIFRAGRILAVSQISKASQHIPGSRTNMDRGCVSQ